MPLAPHRHIAILGAGFSGSALAMELARRASPGVQISLIGDPATFGRGLAYGTARNEHLLNVRAKDMGARADRPGDLAHALALDDDSALGFLPRPAYGDYLQQRLSDACAGHPGLIACRRQRALAITRCPDGRFRVALDDGDAVTADTLVLATGCLPPRLPAGLPAAISAHPAYIASPWETGAIENIPQDARVMVLGTGLTMADIVLSLRRRHHTGPIIAVSRHGLRPLSHPPRPLPPVALSPATRHALQAHDLRALVRALRQQARNGADWRLLADALRPVTQNFWLGLPGPARARFLRHPRAWWEVIRHRVAPEAGQALDELLQRGQLQVRAARLLRAEPGASGIDVTLCPRGDHREIGMHVDVLIRATGLDTDLTRTTDPLIASLRDAGLIRPDPLRLGIDIDDTLQARQPDGTPATGLYCLGPLLRARFWEMTAVPDLRNAARDLADTLLLRHDTCPPRDRPTETPRIHPFE